jgi:hypothetical protein
MRDAKPKPGAAPLARNDTRYRVYRRDEMKLAITGSGETLLFDLKTDPGETRNLESAAAYTAALAQVRGELATWTAALGLFPLDQPIETAETLPLDPAAEQRLRALGYVE